MVYVLKGTPDIWVNGRLHRAKVGDLFLFPFDTGIAHTVINNTTTDIEMLVFGEQDAEPDWIFYPQHPERNKECKEKGWFWGNHPQHEMGKNSGEPGDTVEQDATYPHRVNVSDLDFEESGDRNSNDQTYYQKRDLARQLGAKKIAFNHIVLPSGYRSCLPHAESLEEEFVYVLQGQVIAWINGKRHAL